MTHSFIIIGLLVLSLSTINGQTSPVELWRSTEYVKSINLRVPSIVLDKYQNIYMVTNETDLSALGTFTLVKYDSLGHALWNRHYPPSFAGYFYGSFTVDSLGNTYVSPNFDGGLEAYDAPAILVKYAPTGDKLWETNYSVNQTGDEYILYSELDALGRLILAGSNTGTDMNYFNVLFVSAIDTATGEEIWRTNVPGLIPRNLRVSNNRIDLLSIKYAPGNSDYVIMRLDTNGVIVQEHAEPYPPFGSVQWSYISKNGDVLLGNSQYGYEITRVSGLGDTLWHYQYPNIYSNLGKNWIRHLTEDSSSSVFATGLIRLPGLSAEMMTTKLSSSGEVIWQQIYHSANDSLGDEGDYLVFNDSIVVAAGGTQLANSDVVGVINIYKNTDGEELYNILLGYDNIFVIDQVKLVNDKIYYTGEGFNASINELKVVTGCILLPRITSYTQEEHLDMNIRSFPNPTLEHITITNLDPSIFTYLEVMDIQGRVMLSKKIEQDTLNIDMSMYQAGNYVIVLKGKDIILNKKVIKI